MPADDKHHYWGVYKRRESESGEGLNSPLLTAVSRRTIAAVGVFGHMKTVTELSYLSRDAKSIAHTTVSGVTPTTFQVKILPDLAEGGEIFLIQSISTCDTK